MTLSSGLTGHNKSAFELNWPNSGVLTLTQHKYFPV